MVEGLVTTQFQTLVLGDDHLMVLEPSYLEDRIRRMPFERISRMVVWRVVPVVRIALVMGLMGLPGLVMMMQGQAIFWQGVGAALLLSSSLVTARYLVCGRTILRMVDTVSAHHYSVIGLPGRVDRFVDRLVAAVGAAQGSIRASAPPAARGGGAAPGPADHDQ